MVWQEAQTVAPAEAIPAFAYYREEVPAAETEAKPEEAENPGPAADRAGEPEAALEAGEQWLNPAWGTVTSSCGGRQNPLTHTWELHNGLDIALPEGTEVAAVKSGVVTECRTSPSFGKLVKFRTDDGYTVMYAHLSEILVTAGERVAQGAVVARSGSTGWSTGPHLHYSLWKDGQLLDPLAFLYLPVTGEVAAEYARRGETMPE